MPHFFYEAKHTSNQFKKGTIQASSKVAALSKLSSRGLTPFTLKETETSDHLELSQIRINHNLLIYFTQELGDLLSAGVSLNRCLELMANQNDYPKLSLVASKLVEDIEEGHSLSQSLSFFPKVFSPIYIHLIKSGEVSGQLEHVLHRMTQDLTESKKIKSKIIESLIYPIFLLVMGILAVVVLLIFVLPKLEPLFQDLGATLPLPTIMLLQISSLVKSFWGVSLVSIILLLVAYLQLIKSESLLRSFQSKLLTLPIIGSVIQSRYLAEIFHSLNTLLGGGIQTVTALEITLQTCSYIPFRDAIREMIYSLKHGQSVSQAIKKSGVFPERVYTIIKVGEEAGEIEKTLQKLGRNYREIFNKKASWFTQILGPVFIVIMAGVIGFIITAMLLPILSLKIGF